VSDTKLKVDPLRITDPERRGDVEVWAMHPAAELARTKLTTISASVLLELLVACSQSTDPKVREAWSRYDALVAAVDFLEKPLSPAR
jgi:hypothetical protein